MLAHEVHQLAAHLLERRAVRRMGNVLFHHGRVCTDVREATALHNATARRTLNHRGEQPFNAFFTQSSVRCSSDSASMYLSIRRPATCRPELTIRPPAPLCSALQWVSKSFHCIESAIRTKGCFRSMKSSSAGPSSSKSLLCRRFDAGYALGFIDRTHFARNWGHPSKTLQFLEE